MYAKRIVLAVFLYLKVIYLENLMKQIPQDRFWVEFSF